MKTNLTSDGCIFVARVPFNFGERTTSHLDTDLGYVRLINAFAHVSIVARIREIDCVLRSIRFEDLRKQNTPCRESWYSSSACE